jgi:predicted homoserine dehydrogenase-like protein
MTAHHDLTAELEGYRNALSSAKRYEDTKLTKAIEAEVERVTADIRATIEHHETQAAAHDATGQHTLGAQARERATYLRRAIGTTETATDRTPTERATPPKKAGS